MIEPEPIYARLKERVSSLLKDGLSVAGPRTLVVNKVWTEDNLEANDIAGQLDAKLHGRSWAIPVFADISMVAPDGTLVDRSKRLKVLELPKLTPRYSFIVNAEEFQVANQLRLKPGVYVRSKPTETVAHVKMPIGFSRFNHSMSYAPADKKWTLEIDGKTVPLYAYLNSMDLKDEEIASAAGDEALSQMKSQSNLRRDVAKLRTIVTDEVAPSDAQGENSARIREKLTSLPMSPEVPKMKYGKTYKNFDKGLVLDALQNMKKVLDGDEEPDIDNSRFKEFRAFDDILLERLEKAMPAIQRRITQRMREKDSVRDVVQPERLSNVVTSFFNQSQLSNYPTQSNPLNFLSGVTKTTVFGEGSIGNKRAVPKEDRDIDPSMIGAIDPLHTPDGGDIGAVMHLTGASKKGDGVILVELYNPRTHSYADLAHTEIYDKVVAFPNEYRKDAPGRLVPKDQSVRAIHRGKIITVAPDKVDYVIDSPTKMFDFATNMVPFLNAMHGGRGLMASKMFDQAVPLVHREAPLVQSAVDQEKGVTFDQLAARVTSLVAPVSGEVTAVTESEIRMKDSKGQEKRIQIYKDFPLNARSFITSTAKVKVGDKVKEGQQLTEDNFTKDGTLAIGVNLRSAYLPLRGWGYEDSIVVSEGAARKLLSEHLYKFDHRPSKEGIAGRDKYTAYFPTKFTTAQLADLDDDGVVKIGSKLKTGDPIIAYLVRRQVTPEDVVLGRISRNLVRPYADSSRTWDEPFDGVVTHVVKLPDGTAKVIVKTVEPLQVGDKLVGRHAQKGLVSRIVPDHEMPQTKDGQAIEIIFNPLGMISRMNPGQIYEAIAGKIAEKTGKPYLVQNFEPVDYREKLEADLKKHGLADADELIDPASGRSLGKVTVGKQYILKLEHQSKEKFNAREPSNAYTADLRPAKSGEGAQTIGRMEIAALLAHGNSLANLNEMVGVKATKNDEFWHAVQMNEPLPPVSSTFAFEKFVNLLKAAGVNVERRGTVMQLKPLTDTEVQAMSAGELTSSRMLLGKNLKPEKGGLFDDEATGGIQGRKWTHVELPYDVPNPILEPAIKGVLGITQREFDDIMEERATVDPFGKKAPAEHGGLTGPKAIRRMMEAIDIPKAITELRRRAKTSTGSDLNSINRSVRFLENMKRNGIPVKDLFISKIPVLPPIFRPIYPLPDGTLNVSDVNYLYRDLIAIKNQIKDLAGKIPDDQLREQRADLYQAAKAIVGVGDPVSSKAYRGIVDVITGTNPKGGYFQSRVLSKRQELTGRAAIIGNPTLGIDEAGLPEDMAWTVYKPFIIQRLVARGYSPLEGEKMIADRIEQAREALGEAMAERPILLNRAPTLHKHGIMAFKPRLVPGKSIHLNHLVTVGFGADFDGDQMAVHIPISNAAVEEAYRMMPSANPFNTSEKILVTPRHEAQVGLYRLTSSGRKTEKSYDDDVDALADFHDGKLLETDIVRVAGVETTPGRILVNGVLPAKLQKPDLTMDAQTTTRIIDALARENPKALGAVVDTLKDIGHEYAYLSGFTVGLKDLHVQESETRKVLEKYDIEALKLRQTVKDRKELERRIVDLYSKAYDELKALSDRELREHGSSLHEMIASGGRGNIAQATQIVTSPVLTEDVRGRVHPWAIRTGYGAGMSPVDFWVANYGSRRGVLETKLSTAEPGALTKSMVQTSIENRIVPGATPDAERGIQFSVDDREAAGRYIMKDVKGVAKRGDLFDAQMRSKLKAAGVSVVELGSPLASTHPYGTYGLQYGLDERGKVPRPGSFIGVVASQSIGEPMTQLILGSKHVQGITGRGAGQMTGFEKLKALLTLPEEMPKKALVADGPGVVESVVKAPGGWDVRVNGNNRFTPFEPTVKRGQQIRQGDRLSEGLIDPRDLLAARGLDPTRRYMVDEIYNIFGGNVRKKHIETVVRSVTDTALVTDAAGREHLVEGDIVPVNVVRQENRAAATQLPLDLARGAMLLEEIDELGGLEKILTDEDIRKLKDLKRDKVLAAPNPVKYKAILRGVDIVPMARKDWLAGLSFRRLEDVIHKGVAEGWKSNLAGWNPIAGIAYGAVQPEPGKVAGAA